MIRVCVILLLVSSWISADTLQDKIRQGGLLTELGLSEDVFEGKFIQNIIIPHYWQEMHLYKPKAVICFKYFNAQKKSIDQECWNMIHYPFSGGTAGAIEKLEINKLGQDIFVIEYYSKRAVYGFMSRNISNLMANAGDPGIGHSLTSRLKSSTLFSRIDKVFRERRNDPKTYITKWVTVHAYMDYYSLCDFVKRPGPYNIQKDGVYHDDMYLIPTDGGIDIGLMPSRSSTNIEGASTELDTYDIYARRMIPEFIKRYGLNLKQVGDYELDITGNFNAISIFDIHNPLDLISLKTNTYAEAKVIQRPTELEFITKSDPNAEPKSQIYPYHLIAFIKYWHTSRSSGIPSTTDYSTYFSAPFISSCYIPTIVV